MMITSIDNMLEETYGTQQTRDVVPTFVYRWLTVCDDGTKPQTSIWSTSPLCCDSMMFRCTKGYPVSSIDGTTTLLLNQNLQRPFLNVHVLNTLSVHLHHVAIVKL